MVPSLSYRHRYQRFHEWQTKTKSVRVSRCTFSAPLRMERTAQNSNRPGTAPARRTGVSNRLSAPFAAISTPHTTWSSKSPKSLKISDLQFLLRTNGLFARRRPGFPIFSFRISIFRFNFLQVQCFSSQEPRASAERFFDPQQLVIFRDAIGARRRAGLDLPRSRTPHKIRQECILGLARTVRNERCVFCFGR